mmetsp:Transcript_1632/g.4883  ORF Transcript_1632/g.4883 Transcript_1632/m.4883 type:complete len:463 (+) Transcript_1632:423-1811(+)
MLRRAARGDREARGRRGRALAWPGVSRRRTDAQLERPRPPPRHWRTASGALRAPGAADAPPPAAARRELCVHPPHWRDARRAAVAAGARAAHGAHAHRDGLLPRPLLQPDRRHHPLPLGAGEAAILSRARRRLLRPLLLRPLAHPLRRAPHAGPPHRRLRRRRLPDVRSLGRLLPRALQRLRPALVPRGPHRLHRLGADPRRALRRRPLPLQPGRHHRRPHPRHRLRLGGRRHAPLHRLRPALNALLRIPRQPARHRATRLPAHRQPQHLLRLAPLGLVALLPQRARAERRDARPPLQQPRRLLHRARQPRRRHREGRAPPRPGDPLAARLHARLRARRRAERHGVLARPLRAGRRRVHLPRRLRPLASLLRQGSALKERSVDRGWQCGLTVTRQAADGRRWSRFAYQPLVQYRRASSRRVGGRRTCRRAAAKARSAATRRAPRWTQKRRIQGRVLRSVTFC